MSDITGGAQGTQTDPFRPRPSRRTVVAGAAWAVPAVVGVNALPAWALSPPPCPDYTYTKVRAASQFLSGTLLGTRLSQVFSDPSWTSLSLAELRGLSVLTQPPSASVVDPVTGAESFENDFGPAYRMPLKLQLLQELAVTASVKLGSLVKTDLGAINQFAQAVYNGRAYGSTGAVDNSSGAIDASQAAGSTTYASINLKNLLDNALSGGLSGVGTGLSNVADLSLDVGAIAGRAWQVECKNCINRDYLLAWLKLVVKSPLVEAVYDLLEPIITGLAGTINGLIGPNSVVGGLLTGMEAAIAALTLGTLRAKATLTVSLDVTTLKSRLRSDLFPGSDLLDLSLGDGTQTSDNVLTIDLGILLGGAYQVDGTNSALNGLAPNSSLTVDASAVTNLVTELGKIGTNVVDIIRDLLQVNLSILIEHKSLLGAWSNLARLEIVDKDTNTGPVSLRTILDTDARLKVVVLDDAPLLGPVLELITTLVTTTLNGTLVLIGKALDDLVVDQVLTGAVTAAVNAVKDLVNVLLTELFVTPGVLSLTANAQNAPNAASMCTQPTGAGPEPTDWAKLEVGEYNVAALRLGVVGALSEKLVTLYLARAAVGPISATSTNP